MYIFSVGKKNLNSNKTELLPFLADLSIMAFNLIDLSIQEPYTNNVVCYKYQFNIEEIDLMFLKLKYKTFNKHIKPVKTSNYIIKK